jgi:hypothetical protein
MYIYTYIYIYYVYIYLYIYILYIYISRNEGTMKALGLVKSPQKKDAAALPNKRVKVDHLDGKAAGASSIALRETLPRTTKVTLCHTTIES